MTSCYRKAAESEAESYFSSMWQVINRRSGIISPNFLRGRKCGATECPDTAHVVPALPGPFWKLLHIGPMQAELGSSETLRGKTLAGGFERE